MFYNVIVLLFKTEKYITAIFKCQWMLFIFKKEKKKNKELPWHIFSSLEENIKFKYAYTEYVREDFGRKFFLWITVIQMNLL